jgi:hypothetical protein
LLNNYLNLKYKLKMSLKNRFFRKTCKLKTNNNYFFGKNKRYTGVNKLYKKPNSFVEKLFYNKYDCSARPTIDSITGKKLYILQNILYKSLHPKLLVLGFNYYTIIQYVYSNTGFSIIEIPKLRLQNITNIYSIKHVNPYLSKVKFKTRFEKPIIKNFSNKNRKKLVNKYSLLRNILRNFYKNTQIKNNYNNNYSLYSTTHSNYFSNYSNLFLSNSLIDNSYYYVN